MGRQTYAYMVVWRMRAKTIPHVEYEIFLHVMNEIDILEVKENMCPAGDKHMATESDNSNVSPRFTATRCSLKCAPNLHAMIASVSGVA